MVRYIWQIFKILSANQARKLIIWGITEKKGGLTNVNQNSYICEPEIEIEKKKDKERELDKDIDIESEVEEEIKDSSPASENSLKIISDYFQQEIGILSPNQLEQLSDYITFTKMEVDVVKEAITRAADNSKRSFGYVNSILRNWRQNGILTMVKVEEEQRQFESKKTTLIKQKVSVLVKRNLTN